ncbi:MAG TPA: hypothetical protein PKA58_06950 [Polyangium sp.]|jgi:hypothetical protein|nr:hypothetical protein [Polyangium sp.]
MQAQASFVDALQDPPLRITNEAPPSTPIISRPATPEKAPTTPTFAAGLLGVGDIDETLAVWEGLRRFGVAFALAAAYGLAVGTRDGGVGLLKHAAAVPLAPLAVALVGVPALLIVLTLFDAPVSPNAAFSAASRGAAATGMVLGGLAPAMALFVTTTSTRPGAAISAGLGLILAGIFGLRAFLRAIGTPIRQADALPRTVSGFALAGFALFATALSARIWWSTLPIFGGAL